VALDLDDDAVHPMHHEGAAAIAHVAGGGDPHVLFNSLLALKHARIPLSKPQRERQT